MKTVFLILSLLLLAVSVEASPFLVCDPYPTTAQQPIAFLVTMDGGAPIETGIETLPDGGVRLHYDLSGLAAGNHTVTVQAKSLWGVSASSLPLNFTKPASPTSAPATLTIQAK